MQPAAITALPSPGTSPHSSPDDPRRLASYAVLPEPLSPIPVVHEPWVDRRRPWRVTDTYRLRLPDGELLEIPAGYRYDGASIPRIFWGRLGPHELSMEASAAHDILLERMHAGDDRYTRREIDHIFLALMERQRVGRWNRTLAFGAVRVFGGLVLRIWGRRDEQVLPSDLVSARFATGAVLTAIPKTTKIALAIEITRLIVEIIRKRRARKAASTSSNASLALVQPGQFDFLGWLRGLFRRPPSPVAASVAPLPAKRPSRNDVHWTTARIKPEWEADIRRTADKIVSGRPRYQKVEEETGVPWQLVGILHEMECDCDFGKHLHNGDPLTARTVRVPAGRPLEGKPPFRWHDSAVDALQRLGWHRVPSWQITKALDMLERYNGLGYRSKGIPSPYLWSGTTAYVKGKYVRDGVFDPEAVSKQIGAAPLLLELQRRGFKL